MQMLESSQIACCYSCCHKMDISIEDTGEQIQQKDKREMMVLFAISVVVLVAIISVICVIYLLPRTKVESTIDSLGYNGVSLPEDLMIHSRLEWGSHTPSNRKFLIHPTPLVVISDTATSPCDSFWSCSEQVKRIQEYHMQSSLTDIGYNFLVGGDGSVYEGRGWDTTNMHTGFVSNCNIAISFIGTFVNDRPSKKQVYSALQLLKLGVLLGKISADYKLLAMNQTASGTSPGPLLYNVIKHWPQHWIPTEQDQGHCSYSLM